LGEHHAFKLKNNSNYPFHLRSKCHIIASSVKLNQIETVDSKGVLVGLLAFVIYLLCVGLFVFAVTSYFVTDGMEVEMFIALLAVVLWVIMPVADKMLDYYNDDKHRQEAVPDYPY
jgi:Flp pilus assembly protein TadB